MPRLRSAALLAVLLATWAVQAHGQELEELMQQRQKEEQEMRRLPGTETPGILEGQTESRIRLPEGEKTQRLRIAQDRQVDPKTYIVGPGDALQLPDRVRSR